jgi:basic amino acid/polyamine antiporter, APA family
MLEAASLPVVNAPLIENGVGPEIALKRELKTHHLFALSFGSIIGTGWITGVGLWIGLAGSYGAILGFVMGGIVIGLIGLCYTQLAVRFPKAGGEISYAYRMWGLGAAFICGWFMVLIYISSIAFQMVVIGWFLGILAPGMQGPVLYTVLGEAVHLVPLLASVPIALLILRVNLVGVRQAAAAQSWLTYVKVLIAIGFFALALTHGDSANLDPKWDGATAGGMAGIWAVFAMTPFFLGGFDVVPLAMGERAHGTRVRGVMLAIVGSIAAAVLFYVCVIVATAISIDRTQLLAADLPVIRAFEASFDSSLMAKAVLLAGALGVLSCWNASVFAAGRVLFALGESQLIPSRFGTLHARHATPGFAMKFATIAALLLVPMGKGMIMPIVNTGGSCLAVVALVVCAGLWRLHRSGELRSTGIVVPGGLITIIAATLGALFVLSVGLREGWNAAEGGVPVEWALLAGWSALGGLFWHLTSGERLRVSDLQRRLQLLGH